MNKKLITGIIAFFGIYVIISLASDFYTDFEWFRIYGGENIFWTLFTTKFKVHAIFGSLFVFLFSLNFLLIRLLGGKGRIFTSNIMNRLQVPFFGSPKKALFVVLAAAIIAVGFIMGGAASAYWKEYLMFFNGVPFDGAPHDPIFDRDIGFYIFTLPFLQFLYGWAMAMLVLSSLFSIVFHVLNGGIFMGKGRIELSLFARAHISTLLAGVVFLFGLGYRLSAYELLFAKTGKFYGAGYTAVNANLMAYNVCMVISIAAAALLLFNIFKRSFKLPILVLVALMPVYFILGVLYPAVQQRFVVVPNELEKEKPYIENNIKFTRLAYDVQRAREMPFSNRTSISNADLQKNRDTLENIRLWDWRPLKQTYKQIQELKPYYSFNDVDVDRYLIRNRKTAVNISARELDISRLGQTSQTWQNRHLIYTHGYGAVMSRVDRITSEGLPELIIQNIPPVTPPEMKIDRPEIYYGEHGNPYVITGTSIKPGEFDYPAGDVNKYTTYNGKGGSKLDSFFKRLLFAAAFRDMNILISGNISADSRILYRRNIAEMLKSFAPFLDFDDDPYLVISKGRLYWMVDAYTTAEDFPYSTPVRFADRKINYIRNSVKVVIDAYDGSMDFYVSDANDPIIRTYIKIFPGVFKDFNKMPAEIAAHVRYPEDLFNIQARVLLRYHMTNTNVFYNNEDAWEVAKQVIETGEEPLQSYYFVTRLPDEKESGFILLLPFTPYKKNNMIGFLAAKCDMPGYGELKLYTLPKDKLSYGPLQIEARINQDSEISKLFTLWNQKGSKVIKGNLLTVPVEDSILYVQPIYLKAESSEMPELKRVIVSFADRIIIENDLPAALEKLFSRGGFMGRDIRAGEAPEAVLRELAVSAYSYYTRAEQSMRAGDWNRYGEELRNLRDVLVRMQNVGK
ncbi:MAG: UPF0182 family protein [Spirochaetes bacterium]|jgi:hypothetical protein|nr:UPF0182 family protein [Spirochaetota bacterium]